MARLAILYERSASVAGAQVRNLGIEVGGPLVSFGLVDVIEATPSKGAAPVPLELRPIGRAPAADPEAAAAKSRLPEWTTTTAVSLRVSRQSL
jgi:hypothetical protein